MNIVKSAIAGAASAVGAHYADQAMNPTPYDTKVYYGVAVGGLLGAYFLRNKSPIGAGLLLGLGVGSGYQGYTRAPKQAPAAVPPPAPTQRYPYPSYAPPSYTQPQMQAPRPSGGFSASDVQGLFGQAQNISKQVIGAFGQEPSPQAQDYGDYGSDYDSGGDYSEDYGF